MTKGVCKDCGWPVYAHEDGFVQHLFAGDDDAMHEATLFSSKVAKFGAICYPESDAESRTGSSETQSHQG